MIPCPICSHDMRPWRSGSHHKTCSAICGHILRAASLRARNTDVDEMAVVRLLEGWVVTSTRAERIEAVRVLTNRGRSASWIADYMRTTARSVERYRHESHLNTKSATKGQAA